MIHFNNTSRGTAIRIINIIIITLLSYLYNTIATNRTSTRIWQAADIIWLENKVQRCITQKAYELMSWTIKWALLTTRRVRITSEACTIRIIPTIADTRWWVENSILWWIATQTNRKISTSLTLWTANLTYSCIIVIVSIYACATTIVCQLSVVAWWTI